MPPDMKARVQDHDDSQDVEFVDVDFSDDLIRLWHAQRRRNRQDPTSLEQA